MNITYKTQKIAVFVANIGLVPSLKQVADLCILPVEILCIGKINHLHDARYRITGCFDQKMNVICHEHISVKNEAAFVPGMGWGQT